MLQAKSQFLKLTYKWQKENFLEKKKRSNS